MSVSMESSERELYSVGEVAQRLGLHVRTVRAYVREGRLKAVRIGKQYRIAREDFEALTGGPAHAARSRRPSPRAATWRCRASSRSTRSAPTRRSRLSTLVTAGGQFSRDTPEPLRIQTVYDEARARMKIVVLGNAAATADLLLLLDGVLGPGNGILSDDSAQGVDRG